MFDPDLRWREGVADAALILGLPIPMRSVRRLTLPQRAAAGGQT